jgi:hypothetical protein
VIPSNTNSHVELLEFVLQQLSVVLREPSADFPTVRCLRQPSLIRLLGQIMSHHDGANAGSTEDTPPARPLPASAMMGRLESSGILHQVRLDAVGPRVPMDRFWALGLTTAPEQLDATEVLQAHIPDGVLCYFTAVGLHNLTTQLVAQHHIARLRRPSASVATTPPRRTTDHAPPLGQWQFTRQGVRFYLTTRDPRYLVRTQQRYVHELSRVRMTTLEQTLLDTLHRPMNCGGPAVVFEAWETGLERLDQDVLAGMLGEVDDPKLTRRVGVMLTNTRRALEPALAAAMDVAAHSAREQDAIPLFVGIPHTTIDTRWHVLVP